MGVGGRRRRRDAGGRPLQKSHPQVNWLRFVKLFNIVISMAVSLERTGGYIRAGEREKGRSDDVFGVFGVFGVVLCYTAQLASLRGCPLALGRCLTVHGAVMNVLILPTAT